VMWWLDDAVAVSSQSSVSSLTYTSYHSLSTKTNDGRLGLTQTPAIFQRLASKSHAPGMGDLSVSGFVTAVAREPHK